MKAFLAVLAIFVVLAPSVICDDGSENGMIKFFPKWKNCDSTTKIQFIDFYLDHKPDLKTTLSNEGVSLFNDTITLCAGEGKDLIISETEVELVMDKDLAIVYGKVPAFTGMSFSQGLYDRCLKIDMEKSLVPGQYDLTVQVFDKSQNLIGCVHSDWQIDAPKLSELIQ